jgi:hypothetical protein
MSDKPSIRAAVSKNFVDALDRLEPGLGGRVLATVADADRSRVEAALRIDWLPLEVHLSLNEAAREVAGAGTYARAWTAAMIHTFEQPILKPIVEAGVRLFGLTPLTFARLAPRAWDLLVRDAGALTTTIESSHRARIAVDHFVPELLKSDTFFVGMVGVFDSFFTITRTAGTVTLLEQDLRAGRAVYELKVTGPSTAT